MLIGSSNSEYPAPFTSEQLGKKWRLSLRPLQVKKSIFCGVYYLTVLVYTKTTIRLSVALHTAAEPAVRSAVKILVS